MRKIMVLALALAVGGVLGACSLLAGPEVGSCVEESGGGYDVVGCETAELKVLDIVDGGSDEGCIAVAGVSATYSGGGSDGTLCLGPVDVDPATAVNVAAKGDCLTGTTGDVAEVRTIGCDRPKAEAVVLKVVKDASDLGGDPTGIGGACAKVPGTTSSYTWSLDLTGDSVTAGLDTWSSDLTFCLGVVGVDPKAAPELAVKGDCLRELPENQGYAIVGCGAKEAAYRVTKKADSSIGGAELACQDAPGTTSAIEGGDTLTGWILCVAGV
ncbi:LppU/SCO3897 family protein [Myceligenerans crystallogenes]|uniref:Uncharacterized protein n=1 Tax=Myceligenerans crystallogenes TaxID=316335 RepID=A0ABP4ZH24_9MICO